MHIGREGGLCRGRQGKGGERRSSTIVVVVHGGKEEQREGSSGCWQQVSRQAAPWLVG